VRCSSIAATAKFSGRLGSCVGGHHIILGSAVKGGQIYGTFPTLALGGPHDVGSNGRWIPGTASAQYASTLAQWFGLSAADLPYVLPDIGNFSSNNLGLLD
jgi:uncharacterized protein (DUF1501 family)